MANIIKINTSSLGTDISRIEQNGNAIKSAKDDINDSINSLSAMWEGPAHDRFMSQFTKNYEEMNELCEMLDELLKNLDYAKKEYESCEDKVGDIVRAIQI